MKLSKEETANAFSADMDCAPNVNIFRELQAIHDTGYFSGHVSPEDDWQQVCGVNRVIIAHFNSKSYLSNRAS